jgi:hypothetical protein
MDNGGIDFAVGHTDLYFARTFIKFESVFKEA